MAMEWRYTDGYDTAEFSKTIVKEDSYALAEDEKQLFVNFEFTAASKILTLGIADGQSMIVHNIASSRAATVKNLSGDTGSSVAAGKVAIVYGSTTSDATKIVLLN